MRWLFQDIEQLPAFFSCSYVCGGTNISPYITGPDELCSQATPYTLNNASGATNFTWDQSANIDYISGQGTTTYTVSGNANGPGFVRVVLNGNCENSDPVMMEIAVDAGRTWP